MKLIIFIIIILLLSGSFFIKASYDEYDTVELTDKEIQKFWEVTDITALTEFNDTTAPVISYDVSANGNVVIALKQNQILVLDDNNIFIKQFVFDVEGTYYIQCHENNIVLYLTRSSLRIEFSIDGQLVNMVKIDSHSTARNDLWNQLMSRYKINANNCDYEMKNDMGFFNLFSFQTYSQLIKTNADGSTVIIYNVNSNQIAKTATGFALILLFFSIFIIGFVKKINEYRKNTNGQTN